MIVDDRRGRAGRARAKFSNLSAERQARLAALSGSEKGQEWLQMARSEASTLIDSVLESVVTIRELAHDIYDDGANGSNIDATFAGLANCFEERLAIGSSTDSAGKTIPFGAIVDPLAMDAVLEDISYGFMKYFEVCRKILRDAINHEDVRKVADLDHLNSQLAKIEFKSPRLVQGKGSTKSKRR